MPAGHTVADGKYLDASGFPFLFGSESGGSALGFLFTAHCSLFTVPPAPPFRLPGLFFFMAPVSYMASVPGQEVSFC
jgi:hypothetical protein